MNDEPLPVRLTIGTRGSDLALTQAATTEAALAKVFPEFIIERKIIKTTGDRRTDVSLADVAKAEGTFDKGVFIKELEQALDEGSIDIAVHSLKDMPTVLDRRFAVAAVLERAPVRDVLVSRDGGGFDSLPAGAKVGTSSVRRMRQITWMRPDLTPIDLRGNVPTRLQKLAAGNDYDAILLAEAGLIRLGFLPSSSAESPEPLLNMPGLVASRLDPRLFLPAAGQGAIALEIRAADKRARAIVETLNHPETWTRITAEREFLRLLDGGCHTPVGVFSSLENNTIHLEARVFPEQEGPPRTARTSGTDPVDTARDLYHSLA